MADKIIGGVTPRSIGRADPGEIRGALTSGIADASKWSLNEIIYVAEEMKVLLDKNSPGWRGEIDPYYETSQSVVDAASV